MSKFNKTKTPFAPTEINDMGQLAYKLEDKEELVSIVLTTFLQKSYYESENEIVNRIRNVGSKVDPLFVAKLAIYARREANMRSVSHLLAGELAKRISGKPWAADFYYKIVQRPDDMAEILAYYMMINGFTRENRKIPNSIKKGFRRVLESLDAYQIDKYKMKNKVFSLIDLVRLFRPKPNSKNSTAYKYLLTGKSLNGLYSSKILEKEKTKAGQEATNKNLSLDEREVLIKKALHDTLENNGDNNPVFNILRNLTDIIQRTPEMFETVIEVLTNPLKIRNSKLLPFRFVSAYTEVSKLKSLVAKESSIKFTNMDSSDVDYSDNVVDKVLKALEIAVNLSCDNIPTLEGNTAILIDHSGSVRGDGGGSSLVSAFSKTTTSHIANMFASMLASKQNNIYIGLFGDRLIDMKITDDFIRNRNILAFGQEIYNKGAMCGGSTEQGIFDFFTKAIEENITLNNVIIFSDMVIGNNTSWYGLTSTSKRGSFNDLFKKFRAKYPTCNVITVNLRDTKGTTVFNKNYGVVQISGWSNKIFDVISATSKGYKAIIEEIEMIKI